LSRVYASGHVNTPINKNTGTAVATPNCWDFISGKTPNQLFIILSKLIMKHISLTADQIYKLSKAGFCPQIKSVNGFTEIIDSYRKIGIGFLFSF
jgi:hypothetical protein